MGCILTVTVAIPIICALSAITREDVIISSSVAAVDLRLESASIRVAPAQTETGPLVAHVPHMILSNA